MDADKLQWVLELQDKFSGAAAKMAGVATRLENSLEKVGSKSNVEAKMKSSSKASEVLTGALRRVGEAAVDVGVKLAGEAFSLAKTGVEMALDAASFKESTLDSLQHLLGSAEESEAVWQDILKISNVFHESPKETATSINELVSAGYKAKDAFSLLQTALDIGAIMPKADVAGVIDSFKSVNNAAQLSEKLLKSMGASTGIGVKRVEEELGSLKGLKTSTMADLDRIGDMMKAGFFDVPTILNATQRAMLKLSHTTTVGQAAAEDATTTLKGLWNGIKNAPEQYLLRMNVNDGPLKGFLQKINDALNPESATGKMVLGYLNDVGTKLVNVFGKVTTDDIKACIDKAMEFASAVGKIAETAITAVGAITELGKAMGIVDSHNTKINGGVASYNMTEEKSGDLDEGKRAWMERNHYAEGKSQGISLVEGFRAGLNGSAPLLKKDLTAMADTVPATTSKRLMIESPSKVMRKLGRFIPAGVAAGINDNADAPQKAMGAMLEPPRVTLSGLAGPTSRNTGPSVGRVEINVNLTIDRADSPERIGASVAAEVAGAVRKALDDLASEAGAAA